MSALRRARRLFVAILTALPLAACRDAATAFAPSPVAARANASDFFSALAARFTNVQRSPKFYAARGKLGHSALTPSRLFSDTSVWTSAPARDVRLLAVAGTFANGRYAFDATPSAPGPVRPGDSRHLIQLRRLADDEYEWTTSVDMAVGRLRAEDLANVFSALLSSAAGRDEQAIRADYRATLPRATAALSRLLTVDTIRSIPATDGATDVTLVVGLHPERLRPGYPAFAGYVEKYLVPARYRMVLRDRHGGRWLETSAGGKRFVVRLREKNGRLAPLEGVPRPMPDSLQLTAELSTRLRGFTVGASDLVADFTVVRSQQERGWDMRFRREPDWHLPFAVRFLLRSPLRRPFEGEGSTVRIAIRDSAGGPTLITRRTAGAVKESALLRFLGGLGASAMSDFAGKSEDEENRFTAEVFDALSADIRALPTALGARDRRDGQQ